jgi:hypothetical protein
MTIEPKPRKHSDSHKLELVDKMLRLWSAGTINDRTRRVPRSAIY